MKGLVATLCIVCTSQDGELTADEIVDKYDLFAGSQATDYGEAMKRKHDEFWAGELR